ncbi:MAG: potassium/proton antiporter [Phycisphaerales bacterium JB061]
MHLALSEPAASAVLLLVFGLLMAFSVFFTRTLDRLGVPVVLLFLGLGMLGGSEALGGVSFDNHAFAYRIGTIALILILFDGGFNTSYRAIRESALPSGLLATLGVLLTAGLMAGVARLLGMNWPEALLLGAIVSSTDAAAVFAVLRGGGLQIKKRPRRILEVESCINDPMAVILTVAMIEVVGGGNVSPLMLVALVPLELVVGAAIGIGIGLAGRWLLARLRIRSSGLFPVATLACGFVAYGLATLFWGSGFLAVFAAGTVLGNGSLPYKAGLARVHDAIAWLSQVTMFLMLGLLVFPSKLLPVAGQGLVLGLALALVARPLATWLCLLPMRLPANEVKYICWVGLRGAVPIILAMFPVMADIPGADRIFHIVFFIVVVSAIVPGASIVPSTRWLGVGDREAPSPSAAIEMHSLQNLDGEIRVYHIESTVAACGATFAEIQFPEHASAILVVRGTELIAARGKTRIQENDHVYIFLKPQDEPYIGLLFGNHTE